MRNFAVIGAGYWGPNLIRNFMSLWAYDRIIVCDPDPARLKSISGQFHGIERCGEFEPLLGRDDIEAMAIATPVRFHYPMAKAALEAGKHVLVEKPMATNAAQAKELVDLADAKSRTLMVDHTFLYTGSVEKIAELVRSGSLGEMYYIDSVRVNLGLFQHDVNVLWDLAPHDISIANHVLGRTPRKIRAIGQSHTDSELVDVAYVNIEYGDRITANFHVNWLSPTKIRHMVFAGSNRMVLWNDLDESDKIRVYDKGVEIKRVDHDGRNRMQIDYRLGDAWLPQVDRTEALSKLAAHFVDCTRNGKTPLTSGRQGLEVVRALQAAQVSLDNDGRPVQIDGDRIYLA